MLLWEDPGNTGITAAGCDTQKQSTRVIPGDWEVLDRIPCPVALAVDTLCCPCTHRQMSAVTELVNTRVSCATPAQDRTLAA